MRLLASESEVLRPKPKNKCGSRESSLLPFLYFFEDDALTELGNGNPAVTINIDAYYPSGKVYSVKYSSSSYTTINSWPLALNGIEYTYCEISGTCSTNFYLPLQDRYISFTLNIPDNLELLYNQEYISDGIASDSYFGYFKFRYISSYFYIYFNHIIDGNIIPTDCNITARFHD